MQHRYIINISFKLDMSKPYGERNTSNIVDYTKTKKEALEWAELIDDSVDRALIKDKVTGKIEWLKGSFRD